jgi:Tfp pilus assembly protein PilF
METVKSLLAQDPSNSRIRFMLSMEYMSAGLWAEARTELEELVHRDADYVAGWFQAGRCSEELADEDAAREHYRNGIAAARRTGDAHALSELQAALDILGG